MVASAMPLAAKVPLEDPLIHLRCSTVLEYRRGRTIYSREQPSASVYLVIAGKVKVTRYSAAGQEVVLDIYQADDFFGEAALLGVCPSSEEATAFEDSRLMAWTGPEIESLASRQPRLAIALLQVLARRNVDLTSRVESLAVDNIKRRVARTLIRLSERMGTPSQDGSVQMIPFTHELLSQYVGTSREVVTLHMNQFRKLGFLRYSRRGMTVCRDAFQEWMLQNQ
ncbi:MAG: Crp/Fnr family transcriptional regulator [Acidobacteriia bacterium]|nr:Crp/Fnr family transcriptional regulator [Terriglobia bacterium]